MKQLAAMRVYDATSQLSRLKDVPTLVVGATHDRIASPDVVRTLVENIPGCRFVEFDNAAHGVTIQCAARINALLDELFTTHPAG